jgi:hypothetical protein
MRVTTDGGSVSKNNIMLYSIAKAESHEEATKTFENHPHLGIPEASIEIMVINPLNPSSSNE